MDEVVARWRPGEGTGWYLAGHLGTVRDVTDAAGAVTGVERTSAGGLVLDSVTYRYDAVGRLIAREVNGTTLYTAYDGANVWADFDGTGATTARYLTGAGVDEMVARWRPGDGLAWYLTDHLGTVRAITDATGTAVVNAIGYGAFGEIISQANPVAGDRFAFTGREWEAAAGLYYYRARFYDPGTLRFMSEDPVGFESGDFNAYRYVFGRPTSFTDASGLAVFAEEQVQSNTAAARASIVQCLGRAAFTNLAEAGVYLVLTQTMSSPLGYAKPASNVYVGSTARTFAVRFAEHTASGVGGRGAQVVATVSIQLTGRLENGLPVHRGRA